MKKKILMLLLCLLICLPIVSCGSSDASNENVSELKQRIQELEDENKSLQDQLASTSMEQNTNLNGEESSTSNGSSQVDFAESGKTYTIQDLCEFTINYADLKKEVLPPNPVSAYTYYPEEDGKTYIDLSISIKNLRTTARIADDFGVVKAICGKGYEYDSFSIIEESNGGNFTYTNITNIDPLSTGVVHYLAKIPNEIADDASIGITLDINILGNDYSFTVR